MIECGDTEATITGETVSGQQIIGHAYFNTTDCNIAYYKINE